MPIDICWDNEAKTAIRWDFQPGWTWDEYHAAAAETAEMIAAQPHTVHCIRNLNHTDAPASKDVLAQWKHTISISPSNMGDVIVVNGREFIKAMSHIFQRLNKLNKHSTPTAESVEAARKMLEGKLEIPR